jgi:hypothetical protein
MALNVQLSAMKADVVMTMDNPKKQNNTLAGKMSY